MAVTVVSMTINQGIGVRYGDALGLSLMLDEKRVGRQEWTSRGTSVRGGRHVTVPSFLSWQDAGNSFSARMVLGFQSSSLSSSL